MAFFDVNGDNPYDVAGALKKIENDILLVNEQKNKSKKKNKKVPMVSDTKASSKKTERDIWSNAAGEYLNEVDNTDYNDQYGDYEASLRKIAINNLKNKKVSPSVPSKKSSVSKTVKPKRTVSAPVKRKTVSSVPTSRFVATKFGRDINGNRVALTGNERIIGYVPVDRSELQNKNRAFVRQTVSPSSLMQFGSNGLQQRIPNARERVMKLTKDDLKYLNMF